MSCIYFYAVSSMPIYWCYLFLVSLFLFFYCCSSTVILIFLPPLPPTHLPPPSTLNPFPLWLHPCVLYTYIGVILIYVVFIWSQMRPKININCFSLMFQTCFIHFREFFFSLLVIIQAGWHIFHTLYDFYKIPISS